LKLLLAWFFSLTIRALWQGCMLFLNCAGFCDCGHRYAQSSSSGSLWNTVEIYSSTRPNGLGVRQGISAWQIWQRSSIAAADIVAIDLYGVPLKTPAICIFRTFKWISHIWGLQLDIPKLGRFCSHTDTQQSQNHHIWTYPWHRKWVKLRHVLSDHLAGSSTTSPAQKLVPCPGP
jgi:hypothetical protein